MEAQDKILIRLKLAACLRVLLAKNKAIAVKNQLSGIEDVSLIDSIRQLEASSTLSYTIIQGIFSGGRDIQFSTLIGVIEDGFGISVSDFAAVYDSITDEDIKSTKKDIANAKRKKPGTQKKK